MPQYLDTGSGQADQYLGNWLDQIVTDHLQGFRGQFAYFNYAALDPYAASLQAVATAGYPVHLVIGSNEGGLAREDAENAFAVVNGYPDSSLTVIGYRNSLYHPKTIHMTRDDGSSTAVIGSANFTTAGLGLNVEAVIVLDTGLGDAPALLDQVGNAVDRWRGLAEDGVFSIRTPDDIQSLSDAGIINIPRPPRPAPPQQPRAANPGQPDAPTLGRRQRRWTPLIGVPPIEPIPVVVAAPVAIVLQPERWCKQLARSDAQQVGGNTNPTGKLRLTQSNFQIDHTTYFRDELFANLNWAAQMRGANALEVAIANFNVHVRGMNVGALPLRIDHGRHRIAGQRNVATVLAWGPILGRILTGVSHIGDWVIIERDAFGNFSLTIQQARPAWAP